MCNIAVVSVHTSPLARPGTRDTGGMNVYIRELSREMGRRAHTMDIFTRRLGPDTPQIIDIDERTRIVQIDDGAPEAQKAAMSGHLRQFSECVLDFQKADGRLYDVVHSHYWLSGYAGRFLKAAWDVPHIVMFHTLAEAKNRHHLNESEPAYRIEGERLVAQGTDIIICASEGEKELLVTSYGVPAHRISVIPCGVDTAQFRPLNRSRARRRLGLAADEPVVLFVGRIEPLKGIDILIRAAAQVEERFRLLVVGGDNKDADRKGELTALAAELGISERVSFLDAVPHDDLFHYYNAADICVVPSYYESFGLVALEAMACGVPVVASRVGGLKETLQDGRTGYLVPWHCPEPFAERLDLLLSNPALRRSLGREARTAASRFRWSEVAARVEGVYHDLVSQYRGVTVGAHVA